MFTSQEGDFTFGSGSLVEPKGLYITPSRVPFRPQVLVADAGSNSVKVFDAETGEFVQELSGGDAAGRVHRPQVRQ